MTGQRWSLPPAPRFPRQSFALHEKMPSSFNWARQNRLGESLLELGFMMLYGCLWMFMVQMSAVGFTK
jgi:hypothetical protein